MTTSGIKSQITKHIKLSMGTDRPRMSLWYVGITNNENRRNAEHNNKNIGIKFWKSFTAKSMHDANVVEKYFHEKGTSNMPFKNGAIESSKVVYVFKIPNSKPKGLKGTFNMNNILNELFE